MDHLELEEVRARYLRRQASVEVDLYSLLKPDVWQGVAERQRAMLMLFAAHGFTSFARTRLLEVGCGAGGNLLEFLRMGFQPENLLGVELLEDRVEQARRVLPTSMVCSGDASVLDLSPGSQDVVFQSVVFSSLLDDTFQAQLAAKMWNWVRPGGCVLWYDFVYDNPANPDVRGVPLRRVRELFPQGRIEARRVTLAPPISRRVAAVHPSLYTLFNAMPLLRTHVLAWIAKPAETHSSKVATP